MWKIQVHNDGMQFKLTYPYGTTVWFSTNTILGYWDEFSHYRRFRPYPCGDDNWHYQNALEEVFFEIIGFMSDEYENDYRQAGLLQTVGVNNSIAIGLSVIALAGHIKILAKLAPTLWSGGRNHREAMAYAEKRMEGGFELSWSRLETQMSLR